MKGLLFISHETSRYNYLQSIEIALKGGCRQIQLRMKDKLLTDIEKVGLRAKELCSKYNADLYIDDQVQVCLNINAKGVHLGKQDMRPIEARKILGYNSIIGGTANTFEDIKYLHQQRVNYIGLGPFRYTTTKNNLSPILGLDGYKNIIRLSREKNIDIPILAIGGITVNDIPAIMKTGVSGIALSSAILNAKDPIEETNNIINLIKQYQ